MTLRYRIRRAALAALTVGAVLIGGGPSAPAAPANYPTPQEGDWIARDFRFKNGAVMPELRLHYTTLGNPTGDVVVVLHGTAGSGKAMLTPAFAGELFGPGQPLDAATHRIILPDALGAGASAKPSDGLRMGFPEYTYDDMVAAQHRLLTEGLGITHVRLLLGHSMGGMHVWLWGATHPGFADLLVPMAAQPTAMSGRNWMMRRLLIESIRRDPDWNGGNYTNQPKGLAFANLVFGTATNGGTLALQAAAPTREAADRLLERRLAAPFEGDANDALYQWNASRDYDPSSALGRITDPVLAINAADDERNPPETGVMARAMAAVARGSLHVIPASAETLGHSTTAFARFWKDRLAEALAATPRAPRP
ncbi:alpha/beta fold hydrolase [Azospirillum griseum]|uniref:Alpha/beta fold hydrolase n=1 Tax=Azospirillum griseum TaxID=2496639 RepID=A0A431VMJ6_9PROT|nr:alpha/beta fold hydrolase [Azospirillum griseum]RTR23020.1 alpha/beta fold hydrolase [Azospirillum griseum]